VKSREDVGGLRANQQRRNDHRHEPRESGRHHHPPQAYSPQLAELIAEGLVLPPAIPGGTEGLLSMPEPTGQPKNSAADLDEMRDERL
jgi:hypothetical protein